MVDVRIRSNIDADWPRYIRDALATGPRERDSIAGLLDATFRSLEEKQFSTEGKSGGSGWPALTPRYKAWKDRQFEGGRAFNRAIAKARGKRVPPGALGAANKILQLTGALKRSLTVAGDPSHYREVRGADPKWAVELGTNDEKGFYHFYGIPTRGGLVIRRAIQFTRQQEAEFQAVLVKWWKDRVTAIIRTLRSRAK